MSNSFILIEYPESPLRIRIFYNSELMTEEEAQDRLLDFMSENDGISLPADFRILEKILGFDRNKPKCQAGLVDTTTGLGPMASVIGSILSQPSKGKEPIDGLSREAPQ